MIAKMAQRILSITLAIKKLSKSSINNSPYKKHHLGAIGCHDFISCANKNTFIFGDPKYTTIFMVVNLNVQEVKWNIPFSVIWKLQNCIIESFK